MWCRFNIGCSRYRLKAARLSIRWTKRPSRYGWFINWTVLPGKTSNRGTNKDCNKEAERSS
jgi:hypothetical protein